jgi:ArsR family transcriptional regulator, arsenate/arsenite/antimonite-responsive transcriptional repressor
MNAVFEALAHPTRRAILEMLKDGSRNAGEIASAFAISKPTLSVHLAKLREAQLVRSDRQGNTIIYSINLSVIEDVMLGFISRLNAATPAERSTQKENPI